MDRSQLIFLRTRIQNQIFKSDGNAYEELFTKIIQHKEPEFRQIRPYGNLGDRKNDGYIPSKGTYFQVYAPKKPELKITDAIKKARTDLKGLIDSWSEISTVKRFYFVFNDKFSSTTYPIERELAILKEEFHLESAEVFLAKDLEDMLFQLPEEIIIEIVGIPFSPFEIDSVDYSAINDVLDHIMKHKGDRTPQEIYIAPGFQEKIAFNEISKYVTSFLEVGSYDSAAVRDYFERNSSFTLQTVRDILADMYKKLKQTYKYTKASSPRGDLIFHQLLEDISPNHNILCRTATIVIIAYFFEACDVFEEPREEVYGGVST